VFRISKQLLWHVNAKNLTYPQKPVLSAVVPLRGAKNGQIVGMKLNIVLNGADAVRARSDSERGSLGEQVNL